MKTSKSIRILIASCVVAALSASPALAICSVQGLELMRNLNGPWRGKGAVTPIGGMPEFVSCRILLFHGCRRRHQSGDRLRRHRL